jgi:hypothetical protein
MYTRHAPTATTPITKIAVGKTMSAMTTLPSLSWLGHKLMPEVLAFAAKALFDCANDSPRILPLMSKKFRQI